VIRRRHLIQGSIVALFSAIAFAWTTPAQASTTIDLTSDTVCATSTRNGTPFSASTGDVIIISSGGLTGCTAIQISTDLVSSISDIVVGGGGTVTRGAGMPRKYLVEGTTAFTSVQIDLTGTTSNRFGLLELGEAGSIASRGTDWIINFTGSGGGSGGSSSGTSNSTPQPVLQQFGKPSIGTCDAAQPEILNIGGAESGGWSESWAEWMNGGLGGAVCTRTLVYSNAQGRWTVG